MNNAKLFDRLRALNLEPGTYAVFGSGPLGVRGIKDCHDLDIIVTEKVWREFAARPGWAMREMPTSGEKFLLNNSIELWKTWGPGTWNISELIGEAEIIEDLPFVRLERVLEWKRINGREKDLADIALIEAYLKSW